MSDAAEHTEGPLPDVIRQLPDSVANQIAAGEVILGPESVIKELVENSIDADATSIEIVIKDAGKTLIQVIDNGKGMSVTDARMAFERHATSKIREADDLFALHTMGFRGEALPSMAAVSEVEMRTMRPGDELGTRIVIRGSKVESCEPFVTARGTSIMVRNLFFNVVARRRFLKKDSVELSHIVQEFERLALVNPDVSMKLTHNGTVLHHLQRSSLKERIGALFGKTIERNLIPVEVDTSLVRISGFVGLPSAARARGARQFFFVNGRNMRHLYFRKAVLTCYENLIAKDVQPHYFINFEMPPERIDVNVHPQKHEIKFEDEQSVWQILTAAIRTALGRYNAGVTFDFDSVDMPDIPPLVESKTTPVKAVDETIDPNYTPFDNRQNFSMRPWPAAPSENRLDLGHISRNGSRPSSLNTSGGRVERPAVPKNWQKLYETFTGQTKPVTDREAAPTQLPGELLCRQVRGRYILTETSAGLLIIDQHRAHLSVLYDRMMSEHRDGMLLSQNLLFEVPLDLEPSEIVMLDSSIETVERLGFITTTAPDGRRILTGVPSVTDGNDPAAMLKDLLNGLAEGVADESGEDIVSRMVLILARRAAIKYGQPLTPVEQEHLVNSLFRLPSPRYTPDGRLVIYEIDDAALAHMFA